MTKLKILHLEDLPSDAEMVERELKKGNIKFEKIIVDNRADFENALKEFKPDIILSDHSLPSFNSKDALKIVKQSGKKIPFILITATVSEEFAVYMMKEGTDDYILKDRLQRLPVAILNTLKKNEAENDRQQFLNRIIANEALMNEVERLAHIGSLQVSLINGKMSWSDEACRILGYKCNEIQPTFENFLSHVHRDDLHLVQQILYGGFLHLASLKLSYRIIDKFGQLKYIESGFRLELNAENKIIRLTGFIHDVTEIQQVADEKKKADLELQTAYEDIRKMNLSLENKVSEKTLIMQEALQKLERSQLELHDALNKERELNEIKSRFVDMASHEFRTPLSTVLLSASLISKYPLTEDIDKREKHIRLIKESVKNLNVLLEDFLSLGKLEEGKVSIEVLPFELKEFIHDVVDEMRPSLKAGQQLELSFEGEDTFITDKRLLKNIIINLLSNAIKFSNENRSCQIAVISLEEKLIIQVKDQGIGIAKEDMQYLFSTFYRGKNTVNIEGTGLGLHIVKRYIEMLEGQITIDSELNKGTILTVELPNLKHLADVEPLK